MKPNLAETLPPNATTTLPKYGSSKLDGIRAMSQYGILTTRSLKPVPNKALVEKFSVVQGLDGELIFGSPTDPQVYHKTYSAVMKENGPVDGVTYYVFDLLDKTRPFSERLYILQSMKLPEDVVILPQRLLTSAAEIDVFYEDNLELGFEGAILRNPAAMYKEGRSTLASEDMLKLKPFKDSDAEVLEVYEAMTNNNQSFTNELGRTARSTHAENLTPKGMAGGFTVKIGEKVFNVAPGAFSHKDRIDIWENRAKYVGAILTFRHLPIGEKDVPRHGRALRWRSKLDT